MKNYRKRCAVLCIALGIGLLLTSLFVGRKDISAERAAAGPILDGYIVLIDPGHGGMDGGATGTATQVREAEINLNIALLLREQLQMQGAAVIMTREDAQAVGEDKNTDMRNRRNMIETSGQDITVSIHQNSFPDGSVSGPQVIYAPGSAQGQVLATCIQTQLNTQLAPKKPREVTDGDYYIVKSGKVPAVIVECGFISNSVEEALLCKPDYQQRVANAISQGIAQYLLEAQEERH